jgi:hypothetical protein
MFFNSKAIEQPCPWPQEYTIDSHTLALFTDHINQYVEFVCKSKWNISPPANLDEASRKRFEFDGKLVTASVGWSPYQIYCGILDCHCEKDFGVPHFYHDVLSIDRNIDYNILTCNDSKNNEVASLKEELYHKMFKANAIGKGIWPDAKNRVRQRLIDR